MPPLPASPTTPAKPASWLRRRVLDPFLDLLRQGLAPEQLALNVALGITIGIIPLFGVTTALAALVAWRLRLNVAAMQLVCHLITPVQLLLLLPLLRLGARLLGGTSPQELSIDSIKHLIATDWRGALHLLWRAELGALGLWLVGGAALVGVLYLVLKPIFRQFVSRSGQE